MSLARLHAVPRSAPDGGYAAHVMVIALVLACGATAAVGDEQGETRVATPGGWGAEFPITPLKIRDLTLPHGIVLGFKPTPAETIGKGRLAFEFMYSHASHFIMSGNVADYLSKRPGPERRPLDDTDIAAILDFEDDAFFFDGEFGVFNLIGHYGLSRRQQISLTLQYLRFTGGTLDGLVEGFHDFVGVSQNGRDLVGRDLFQMVLHEDNGLDFVIRDRDTPEDGFGDPVLNYRYAFPMLARSGWRFAIDAAVKIPVADEDDFRSSGKTDFGLLLAVDKGLGKRRNHHLIFNASYVWLGDFPDFETDDSGGISVDWAHPIKPWVRGSLQIVAQGSVLEEATDSDLAALEFQTTYGLIFKLKGSQALSFGFTENFVNYDNTTDIAFHLGYAMLTD